MMASSCRWIINMRALKRHLLTIYPVQFNPIHIGGQGLAFHKGNGGILQRYFQLKGFNDSKMLLASLKLRGKCSNKKALVSQGALAQNTYSRNTHKQWKKTARSLEKTTCWSLAKMTFVGNWNILYYGRGKKGTVFSMSREIPSRNESWRLLT